jgi:hypothetical protein
VRFGTGRRIAIAALVAAVLVAIGLRRFAPDANVQAPTAVEVSLADRFFAFSSASIATAKRAIREPQPRAMAALPPARKASEVEVCGIGSVNLASPEAEAYVKRTSDDSDAAMGRLAKALQGSDDAGARSLGLYLGSIRAGAEAARGFVAQEADCGADEACQQRRNAASMRIFEEGGQPSIDTLARSASATRDPMVYAVAVQACRRAGASDGPSGACQLVSAEQWARLDPDNAIAWLEVAASARSRKDAEAEAEALQRVASARESRLYGDRLPDIALSMLPSDVSALERQQVTVTLMGIFSAWTFPDYQAVTRYCSVEAVRDANRSQSCDAIASALVSRGSTLIDVGVGIRVGERVGWSGEKLTDVSMQRDAMRAILLSNLSPPDDEVFSCRWMDALRTHVGRLARAGGEIGAARLAIRESGKTIADLAQEYRSTLDRMARESRAREDAEKAANAAASAASSGW